MHNFWIYIDQNKRYNNDQGNARCKHILCESLRAFKVFVIYSLGATTTKRTTKGKCNIMFFYLQTRVELLVR